ncbi:unnamed protein product [Caenorhabditis auriculariae]|uniref:Medium-chain acyl-CoA ligase ACSF2, mitochondrial n=1 Tax=Caenorhabditis auriculariae TaxID=2777116 RepID=A0A8S1GVW1_9PELO|nr:unnamed protein product [Caenorhabditis auriculariae]
MTFFRVTSKFCRGLQSRLTLSQRALHNPGTNNSYVHGPSTHALKYETLGETLQNAVEATPDKNFVTFSSYDNLKKTYAEFYDDARRMAAGLISLGLVKGDRIGVWGNNYYEWVVMQYACAIGGFVQVNVNPNYMSDELRFVLRKVKVRCLVTPSQHRGRNFLHSVMEVVPEMASGKPGIGAIKSRDMPHLEHIIVYSNDEPVVGAWSFNDVWSNAGSMDVKKLNEFENLIRPDDAVNIQFTSGTTGHPKAATLTHHNINNNGYFVGKRAGWHMNKHNICIPNPLYHCFGCVLGVVAAVNHQQTCVFPSIRYNVKKILESVEREKCTFLFGTPTMFIDIVSSPLLQNHDVSSLKGGFIAGAPCPYALCRKMVDELNMKDIYIIYGSTELSPAVTMSKSSVDTFDRIKSVGHVMPHAEIAIVDESGKTVPKGVRGELWARGYMTMLGYWGDEEKTKKEISQDRWYHTGDTASMNEDETINIVGRSKDMIIRGGENVYPTEIEQFLFQLPYIADAQVVGVPDERYGEAVCVWIRLKEEYVGKIQPEDIRSACKGKIAHYKVPRYVLIKEQQDFPVTATGKIKKFELRKISKELLNLGSVSSHFNENSQ